MMETISSRLIPSVWNLPEYFHRRLGDRAGRQRAMVDQSQLLLVLHEPPKKGTASRQARLFFRKPDGSWLSSYQGHGLADLKKHIEEFEKQIEALDLREDHANSADEYFALTEELLPLKRTISNLYATLDEARKSLPNARELINLRDHAYDVARSADLLWEAVQAGSNIAQVRRAEEQARHSQHLARSAHRLNLLAAFFFPLATLGTVFGMQLNSGLEKFRGPGPFIAVVAAGLLMGMAIYLLVAGKQGKP